MDDILKECQDKMQKALKSFTVEISKIRGGAVNKSIFDDIKVDYYGAQTPLNQLCNINTNEASSIILSPYDVSVADEIVKAIQKSDLGINPTVAGEVIRIIMPPLTEESRKDLIKKAKGEAENGRVAIRNIRRDAMTSMKNLEKGGELTEDDISDSEKDIQEITEKYINLVDQSLESKEKDLLTI